LAKALAAWAAGFVLGASAGLAGSAPVAAAATAPEFHVEEATIADIQGDLLAKQITRRAA
jgi:hypothetical protein